MKKWPLSRKDKRTFYIEKENMQKILLFHLLFAFVIRERERYFYVKKMKDEVQSIHTSEEINHVFQVIRFNRRTQK
jgi:hypothetical protein